MESIFTKEMNKFCEMGDFNYAEIYDLYLVSVGRATEQFTFNIYHANGSDDMIISHKPMNINLRLTQTALSFFPKWIKKELMKTEDAEFYYTMNGLKEKGVLD